MPNKDQSFQALTLSLLVHLAIVLLSLYLPVPSLSPQTENIEVEFIPNPATKSQTFVPDLKQESLAEKLHQEADYLSRLTQRVKEQMKARNNGPTQNRAQAQPKPPREVKKLEQFKPTDSFGIAPTPQTSRSLPVIGSSSLGEHIPGVKEGSFTALNTDQFMFYSFFSRIHEQVRNRWVRYVREFAAQQSPTDIRELSQAERIFSVEIVLDEKGQYIKGSVLRTSGYVELDDTAIKAFRSAAPFHNPPQEMREGDGFIHLYYNFVINWTPYQFAGR